MTRERPSLFVDDVNITDELHRRPLRVSDYRLEAEALGALAEELAERPEGLLQKLCDSLVNLGVAQSAGISLRETVTEGEQFRWVALAGEWSRFKGGVMPFDASPCGVVIARDAMLLFQQPDRFFPAAKVEPPIHEILLVPFHAGGRPIGTLWINAHDTKRKFDGEDVRLLTRLGLCPLAWCSFGVATTITGLGRVDQAARVGRLTRGSSPIGAMLSRVM